MAFNNEIEEVKAQLKVLQSKLSFLEELEKTKSRKEKDYKRVYGTYPNYYNPSQWEIDSWDGFYRGYDMGYDVAQKDYKVGKYQETTQEKEVREWDVVRESMNWCKDHPGQNPLDWVKPQTPEQVADGLKEAFREAVKQGVVSSSTKQKSLYDLIGEFLNEIDYQYNTDTEKEYFLEKFEEWLPKEHDTNSYKWNECIRMIKENLR